MIEAIHDGISEAFREHNAALSIDYIGQLHEMGIINDGQFQALVAAVNEAAESWLPIVDKDGLPLTG